MVEAGSIASSGTILVAGYNQIIVALVAHEGADVPSSANRFARSSRISLLLGRTMGKTSAS